MGYVQAWAGRAWLSSALCGAVGVAACPPACCRLHASVSFCASRCASTRGGPPASGAEERKAGSLATGGRGGRRRRKSLSASPPQAAGAGQQPRTTRRTTLVGGLHHCASPALSAAGVLHAALPWCRAWLVAICLVLQCRRACMPCDGRSQGCPWGACLPCKLFSSLLVAKLRTRHGCGWAYATAVQQRTRAAALPPQPSCRLACCNHDVFEWHGLAGAGKGGAACLGWLTCCMIVLRNRSASAVRLYLS